MEKDFIMTKSNQKDTPVEVTYASFQNTRRVNCQTCCLRLILFPWSVRAAT